MNICLIGHEFYGNVLSGNGSFAISLAEGLIKNGHRITFITPWVEGLKRIERKSNLTIIRLSIFKNKILNNIIPNVLDNRWMFALRMRSFGKRFDFSLFDLIHVLDINDSHFIDTRLKKLKVPLVVSVNDYYCLETSFNIFRFPYHTSHLLLRFCHYKMQFLLNHISLKRFDFIVANTKYLKRKLIESYQIAEEKISVIYRGKDVQEYYTSPGKYESKRVLFIGANMERKGIVDVIKAANKVIKSISNVTFVIVGGKGAKLNQKIMAMIDKVTLGKNFVFYDHLKPEKVRHELSLANVFVLPAHIENLAQSILEAMASKTPVVVTDVGGNQEAVNSDMGFIVKKNDHKAIAKSILQILGDSKLAKRLGENGYNNIKNNFSAHNMLTHYDNLYKKIIGTR